MTVTADTRWTVLCVRFALSLTKEQTIRFRPIVLKKSEPAVWPLSHPDIRTNNCRYISRLGVLITH